jgi:hypothetical protein
MHRNPAIGRLLGTEFYDGYSLVAMTRAFELNALAGAGRRQALRGESRPPAAVAKKIKKMCRF